MNLKNISDVYKLMRLYIDYGKAMYNEAIRILDDKSLAEDVLQESIRKAAPNLHKIDEKNRYSTLNYLVTISRNTAKDVLKKQSKERACESIDALEDESENPLEIVIHNETVDELSDIIKGLPDIYRDVFLLRVVKEHSREETADILGISLETVKKRFTRAKKMILEEYERRYGRYE